MVIKQVSVRGGSIATALLSAGNGAAVVYLSWMRGLAEAQPWLLELAKERRVLAPVHPGCGDSIGAEQLEDVLDFAHFYFDLADELGLGRFHLIGHSMGGMIAAEMAAMNSGRFASLTLIAPAGLWLDEAPVSDLYVASPEEARRMLWAAPDQDEATALSTGGQTPEEPIEAAKALAASTKLMWPIPDKGLRKRIHRVKCPTLLLWGERDGFIPVAYGYEFARLIPQARLEVLGDAGHFPMVEAAQPVTAKVREFITAHP